MNYITSELNHLLQKQREETSSHTSIDEEYQFYRGIQQGIYAKLSDVPPLGFQPGMGMLSQNPFRNEVFHGIVMIALTTRFCVESGLDSERAYTLSDLFINKIDTARSISEVNRRKREAILAFSQEMRKLKLSSDYSIHITRAKEYIEAHIAEDISNVSVAEAVGVHENYLSSLFKKETGDTLSIYINKRKCTIAGYMLEEGHVSCSDIANFLYFSSCSHFITVFKKYVGMTPNAYRKAYYRKL